jgi:hypothetical protein
LRNFILFPFVFSPLLKLMLCNYILD